jgi:hypothetical protein
MAWWVRGEWKMGKGGQFFLEVVMAICVHRAVIMGMVAVTRQREAKRGWNSPPGMPLPAAAGKSGSPSSKLVVFLKIWGWSI